MATTVKILHMTLDGVPLSCLECGTVTLTLDARGPFAALATVWATCANSHSWAHQMITVSDLEAIQANRTGRQRPQDADLFEITIGGAVLAGELYPDLTPEDVKAAGRIYWRRLIKPALRKQKRRAVRAVTQPVKQAARSTVAAAKATALEAAWTTQAGGYNPDPDYQPEPINPCPACNGRGTHSIDSHLHTATSVRCSVCHGTGEID
ncbi:hypothetical protein [Streptomyces sp. P9-1]|uniref:hypothetical protein n=1 Tax=Streptomyces sp. P9-1 TaxID=3422589 RepID=UPI003D35BB27